MFLPPFGGRRKELVCPTCGVRFYGPSAEDLSFNGAGACPTCSGTGIVRTVDRSTLVPDENLTIEEGAVVVWGSLMWSLMVDVCREMGVRTNVPFKDLTDREKKIVFEGPAEKSTSFTRAARIPILLSLTSRTSTRSTPLKMRLPKSRTSPA